MQKKSLKGVKLFFRCRKKVKWVRKKVKRWQNFLNDAEKKFEGGRAFFSMQLKGKMVQLKSKTIVKLFR
jgi:hypothetical protein